MLRKLVLALAACVATAPAALAQSVADPQWSVLQIRCFHDGRETKATGFVWPEPGYMVTALHAVAGCENGVIHSEWAREDTRIDRIVAVDREPDLALVRLVDDLGIPALVAADTEPNASDPHFIWGYPMAAEKMSQDNVRFSIGLSGLLTTLGGAYSHEDLQRLYRAQDFPARNTQIFRVASLLQHGQSGAPILDAEGRVVAIADGGLLGGWRGMNWSIPAHVYLPSLRNSQDEIPRNVSQSTLLMNSFAVREERVVPMGGPAAAIDAAKREDAADGFGLAGLLALGAVRDELRPVSHDVSWIYADLDEYVREDDRDDMAFEVRLDDVAGRWIVAPSGSEKAFDPATGTLAAVSGDGEARFAHVHFEAESFEAALRDGPALLLRQIEGFAGAEALSELLPAGEIDDVLEYVNHDFYEQSEDGRIQFDVVIQINGPEFSGRVVHRSEYEEEMSEEGWRDYQMMLLAAYGVTDLASYYDPFQSVEWLDDGLQDPTPSALTLARRVPLAEVAKFFVEDRDFAWKSDLAALRDVLSDPSDFDTLHFDVYEDRATGATVAVPEGTELAWNPDLGAVEGLAGGGRVHLAIAIHRGATFDAVTGDNVLQFIDALSEKADWDDLSPVDCQPDISRTAQVADCWDTYGGYDMATGERADLHLGLTAVDEVFLGTSVYIVGAPEDLTDRETVDYLMMLIGAEYLSDFAVH